MISSSWSQDEAQKKGERPIIKEDFDIASFGVPDLDLAVSCLSAKYHSASETQSPKQDSILDELSWHLPGWGESKDDCGDFLKAVGCPGAGQPQQMITGEKHTRKVITKHCFNPECPICFVPWAVREGNKAADRMMAAERLYRAEWLFHSEGSDLQDARHFTFSPPQDAAKELMKTKKGYKRLKAHLIKIMKAAGLKGGAIIFHSHRVNKYKELYVSPHFHVIGYGFIQTTKAFYKASAGWIYKNMGKRASLAGTIIYALDHCGLAYDVAGTRIFHALFWFGCLSYNKLAKKEVIKAETTVPCKMCKAALHEYALVVNPDGHGMSPDWSQDMGEYKIIVKTIVYALVKRKKQGKGEPPVEMDFKRFEREP